MKKPKPVRRGTAKKAKPWAPVPIAVQRKQHRIAVRTWKPTPVSVQRKRHLATVKAGKTRAKGKVRKLSPGYDVACCAAQAVGTLLGLTDAEVLALYWLTADGPDDGASIEDTLDAAAVLSRPAPEHSLPGADLWQAGPFVEPTHALILGLELPEGPHAVLATGAGWWSWGDLYDPSQFPGAVIDEAWAVTW